LHCNTKTFCFDDKLSSYSGDNEIFFLILFELIFMIFIILMIQVRTSTKKISELSRV